MHHRNQILMFIPRGAANDAHGISVLNFHFSSIISEMEFVIMLKKVVSGFLGTLQCTASLFTKIVRYKNNMLIVL